MLKALLFFSLLILDNSPTALNLTNSQHTAPISNPHPKSTTLLKTSDPTGSNTPLPLAQPPSSTPKSTLNARTLASLCL